eukprot:jgi/Botrbrau1/15461/Bobra.43_2s0084.1
MIIDEAAGAHEDFFSFAPPPPTPPPLASPDGGISGQIPAAPEGRCQAGRVEIVPDELASHTPCEGKLGARGSVAQHPGGCRGRHGAPGPRSPGCQGPGGHRSLQGRCLPGRVCKEFLTVCKESLINLDACPGRDWGTLAG